MNYYFVIKGDGGSIPDTPAVLQYMEEWERPVLNQEITLKGKSYTVVGISPPSNPANAAVTYYLERTNPNYPYKR